jgi:hypothetical protein
MTLSTRIGTALAFLTVVAIVALMLGGDDRRIPEQRSFAAPSGTSPGLVATAARTVMPSSAATIESTATPEPTWAPAPAVDPAPDDDLVLAGHGAVPGLLYCSNARPFGFGDLNNPPGAETMVGPEYDALRSAIGNAPTREVARDVRGVTFLADDRSPGPWEHGRYLWVDVARDGPAWTWTGAGDCEPRAWAPRGYGAATWTLDPAYRQPRRTTQVLHLLVSEVSCSSGRTAHGRIGPAYVTYDSFTIRIELLVRHLPGGQDCPAVPPTPARLRLSEPVGDRNLKDMNGHVLTGTGG